MCLVKRQLSLSLRVRYCFATFLLFNGADEKRFRSVLSAALWKDNVLRLKAQVQVRSCPTVA